MKNKQVLTLTILTLIVLLSVFAIFLIYKNAPSKNSLLSPTTLNKQSKQSITLGDKTVYVEVANDNASRARGLSGKKSLKEDEGMLFLFDQDTFASFWMKDMNFPLDIIWIYDSNVVAISKNIPAPAKGTPNSQLPLYRPEVEYDTVLEVNAGFSDKYDVQEGDRVSISDSITQ